MQLQFQLFHIQHSVCFSSPKSKFSSPTIKEYWRSVWLLDSGLLCAGVILNFMGWTVTCEHHKALF